MKRAASFIGSLALVGLAGCSSQNARFDGYGFDGGYANASTGSVPRDAGYSNYNNDGGSPSSSYGSYSRGHGSPADVTRKTLPPLSGAYDAPASSGYKQPGGFQTADGYSNLNRGYGGRSGAYDRGEEPAYREERAEGAYPHRGSSAGKEITVAPGDTLYGLALRYDVPVRDLERANGLAGQSLRAGQSLIIPSPSGGYERKFGYQGGGYGGGARKSNGYDGEGYDAGGAYSASRAPAGSLAPKSDERCPNCYTVKSGDSLFIIGERYGVGPAPLAHHNKLSAGATLRPGQVIMIPGDDAAGPRSSLSGERPAPQRERYAANRPAGAGSEGDERYQGAPSQQSEARGQYDRAPRERDPEGVWQRGREPALAASPVPEADRKRQGERAPAQSEKVAAKEPEKLAALAPEKDASDCEDLLANPQPRSSDTFRQPVEGLVISKFGNKDDGTINDGVNYAVPKGTPVKAAENGVVTYVGTEIAGFGNLILIRHAGDFVSAYAHNDEVLVKRCDIVKRGQVVAKAGATGTVSKPQLHFELRKASKPVNPEEFFTAAKEP
ncbi:MAG: LysM peptidoglycan-binding domain-containing M23 family metallopeptidase [Hyphomicrobiales bacterium]|nr:LysM peptidoglycan-binding domain-containing M23 family metallopeptidase [Hyphomicrobiales bacterium]